MKQHLTAIRHDIDAGDEPLVIAERYGLDHRKVRWWLNQIKPNYVRDAARRRLANRDEPIVMDLLRGTPIKKVAAKTGLKYTAIWAIGRRYGVKRITEQKAEKAREWMERHDNEGESLADIARSEGLPRSTVVSAVARLRSRLSVHG